ncbi:HEXXH motif-containing putative peptide modification protein [Streptomyces sp. NPDC000594]|uniref:aKG-HExxH-type peptide beta-hydroxylase n=1 Tax=Streptomyces sp. NPDC000594 TaxID=3154261 RepID=UPI003333529A
MRFLNYGHLCESMARFTHALTGNYPTVGSLRSEYAKAINQLRPPNLPADPDGFTIGYEESGWVPYCRTRAIFPHIVGPATTSPGPVREMWDTHVMSAVELLHEIDPGLRDIVLLFVTDVVVLNSQADGGGSANRMPGVVIMSPAGSWKPLDYAMCLVHEALHHALFVLEAAYGMFTLPPEALAQEENRAYSAIKMERRAFHAAFHAAAVTVPLLAMEAHQGGSSLLDQYSDSLRASCEDMRSKRHLCTPYGQLLLDELCSWSSTQFDYGLVLHSLTSPQYSGYKPPVTA